MFTKGQRVVPLKNPSNYEEWSDKEHYDSTTLNHTFTFVGYETKRGYLKNKNWYRCRREDGQSNVFLMGQIEPAEIRKKPNIPETVVRNGVFK